MRKITRSVIPTEYWGFTQGIRLGDVMYGNGQEALDMLNSVERALNWAISDTVSTGITAELKKARRQIVASMNACRKAVDMLKDGGF
jgi:hypothetical protein